MTLPPLTAVPAFRPGYRMQWEPVQDCHVLLYPEGMVKLNDSAAEVLKRVDGQRPVSEIITELQACFPSAPALDEDVLAFIGEAHEQHWIRSAELPTRPEQGPPLWLLAELTYRCPLQCPYCSNPLEFAEHKQELTTAQWIDVFSQARALGAAQLGFSGGEPLVRDDLAELIKAARDMGYYTNLITSGMGLNQARIDEFLDAGLDHIQISFQASDSEVNNMLAGSRKAFDQKLAMARAVKAAGYPMVLNFVTHRHNIDQIEKIIELCLALEADFVELATCQYYGWAHLNRAGLLPTKAQLDHAEAVTNRYRAKLAADNHPCKLILVTPDYYEDRPKGCMNGWGNIFLTITPDGTALPCHSARQLPVSFPKVPEHSLSHIWYDSFGFNRYRGDDWMQEPCRSCPEKHIDFGGCRCQAYMLTGDATQADPVCSKSPHHHQILAARAEADLPQPPIEELTFRNERTSRIICKS